MNQFFRNDKRNKRNRHEHGSYDCKHQRHQIIHNKRIFFGFVGLPCRKKYFNRVSDRIYGSLRAPSWLFTVTLSPVRGSGNVRHECFIMLSPCSTSLISVTTAVVFSQENCLSMRFAQKKQATHNQMTAGTAKSHPHALEETWNQFFIVNSMW